MTLPKEAEAYYRNVVQRCEYFIETAIWTGINKITLRNWLANFRTDKEKYFVACILDHVIYRTKEQTIALIKHLFKYTLPDLINKLAIFTDQIHEIDSLLRNSNYLINRTGYLPMLEIRFVGVIKSGDSMIKSSHYIGRLFKKDFAIYESLIITPAEIENCIKDGVKLFVFFDDFLGSGTQFKDCIEKENIESLLVKAKFIYAPLVAHKKGIEFLKNRFPSIELVYVEFLDESNGVFNDKCNCFTDGVNTPIKVKKYYYELLKNKKINLKRQDRKGFGNLELVYIFEHASPDNTLPLLWWPNTSTFKPLFKR